MCRHCPSLLHFSCTFFFEDCPFQFAFFYLFSPLTPRKGKDVMASASLITSHCTADQRAASSVVTSICAGSSGELVCLCMAECLGEIGEW